MKLSLFIRHHSEEILSEWEAFAKTLLPGAEAMSTAELRDHAQQMLEAIARDLESAQTNAQRDEKSKGQAADAGPGSAAATHGGLRGASGFTLQQVVSEFRALRASVLKLWSKKSDAFDAEAMGDITRFNEAMDQALAESVEEFDTHSARTRDTFLAVLGHDLRGPLASMASAGDYLIRPEARTGDLVRIGESVKRGAAMMASVVGDLIEYSRTQLGGTIPVNPQVSDLRTVALAALHNSKAAHAECPLELVAEGDLVGEFDAVRIQQVITNLLSSACQNCDKHFRVSLSLHGTPEHLSIGVQNRGSVIPESAFEAIFDPLVQLELPAHGDGDDGQPTSIGGLGLFIAREISLAHGGTLTLASSRKEGTTFTVKLPRIALHRQGTRQAPG